MLKSLVLNDCSRIQSLPKLPITLKYLEANNCSSLETIASPQDLSKLYNMEVNNCDRLVEIQDLFKIETINNVDKATVKSLGWSNLESLANVEVHMFNGLTSTGKITSPQVLHECGILSIFLPGNDIPKCFSLLWIGPSVSFDVLPLAGHKINALNLCISYALSHDILGLPVNPLFVKITTITKGARWSYNPTCYAIPKDEDDSILWLSHWTFGYQLDFGDQINVSVITPDNLRIKMCGVLFNYEAEHKGIQSKDIIGKLPWASPNNDSDSDSDRFLYIGEKSMGMEEEFVPH